MLNEKEKELLERIIKIKENGKIVFGCQYKSKTPGNNQK